MSPLVEGDFVRIVFGTHVMVVVELGETVLCKNFPILHDDQGIRVPERWLEKVDRPKK